LDADPLASTRTTVSIELVASSYKGHALLIVSWPDVGVPLNVTADGTGDT
jgi:hypothetical protein